MRLETDDAGYAVFRLKVKCTRGEDGQMVNSSVTSSMLTWLPGGSQLPDDSETKLTAFMSKQVRDEAARRSLTRIFTE
jgi:hypothetical protein